MNTSRYFLLHCCFRRLIWRLMRDKTRRIKRALDICFATLLLFLALPLMLVIAALIKVNDGGPVLFWQTRVGKWGRPFAFPKFRSMVVNAEALQAQLMLENHHQTGLTFKMRHDPRVSWIGKIIRKTSLDELPQLWCVLKGEMSLVGPRPALLKEVAHYSLQDRQRLEVTPGLTCIWQVSGRADIPFAEQVAMDLAYIEQQSLRQDLKLLAQTIPAVISGRGAY